MFHVEQFGEVRQSPCSTWNERGARLISNPTRFGMLCWKRWIMKSTAVFHVERPSRDSLRPLALGILFAVRPFLGMVISRRVVPRGTTRAMIVRIRATCGTPVLSSRCGSAWNFLCAYKKEPPQGVRHLNGFAPVPGADLLNLGEVPGAYPEDNLFRCYLLRVRPVEKGGKFAERPRTHEIERGDLLPKLLIAPHQHLRVRKSQFTNDFREKCGFLEVGFDQENPQAGADNFQGETRKSASGPNVGEPTGFKSQRPCRVHAFAKMTI
jgi:hypothetical protein